MRGLHDSHARRELHPGGIHRFAEGWWIGAFPQLATYHYAWAFELPGMLVFDRVELCAHMEFVAVLFTLAAIPSVVRALVGRPFRATFSWLTFFLFPCVFLYDSNLSVGADHIAAVFAAPIALTLIRFLPRFDVRSGVLLGVYLASALITKYSAVILVAPPLLLVATRVVWLLGRSVRRGELRWARGLGALALTGILLTSVHWLKNWIWYGDPLYPELRDRLAAHPWSIEAEHMHADFVSMMGRPRPGLAGVIDGVKATLTFSFIPNDWPVFHRDWPTFGSLFTLTLPFLLFLRRSGRLFVGYLATMMAVFVWYEIHHYDRYLQAVFPWMVAATAATLVRVWRQGPLPVRAALVGLVGLQVVWGGDVPFFPTHNLIGDSMIHRVATDLAAAFQDDEHRLDPFAPWTTMGRGMPKNARVLVHEIPMHLGLQAPSVQDLWVGGLSYSALADPAAIYDRLTELGVTHVAWRTEYSDAMFPLSSDLAFFEFLERSTVRARRYDDVTLAWISGTRPAAATRDRQVLVYSCKGLYRSGWYPFSLLADLGRKRTPRPRENVRKAQYDIPRIEREADFVVHEARCNGKLPPELKRYFSKSFSRDGSEIWIRKLVPDPADPALDVPGP
jgi:hypothetical protein